MKKNMIALAVATAFAAPAVMADATLYGKANLGLTKQSGDAITGKEEMKIGSYGSRLGIKGDNDLGDGLKAVYQMEFEIDMATTSAGGIKNRNQFVGLAGGFGTVMLGNIDSPLKSLEGKTSMFEDTSGDMEAKKVGEKGGEAGFLGEQRYAQSLMYVSPKFEGVQVAVQSANNTGANKDTTTSASIVYTGVKGLMVGLAMDNNATFSSKSNFGAVAADTVDGKDAKTTVLAATYKMDDMKFGFAYETAEKANGDKRVVPLVSASYKMDKTYFKLQYQKVSKDEAGTVNEGDSRLTLGADYKFNKSTTAAFVYTNDSNDADSNADVSTIGIHMITKF
jgi:predicted porin